MNAEFFFSDPSGDIPVGPSERDLPLLTAPECSHPFLTLGNYLDSIEDFIFTKALHTIPDLEERDPVRCLKIRSEKQGIFYHVLSIEIQLETRTLRAVLNVAISDEGRSCMLREYETLSFLFREFPYHYIPEPYCLHESVIACQDKCQPVSYMLAQWFEGFHEWHVSDKEGERGRLLFIWDTDKGHRPAQPEEAFAIIRQASRIATLYFDPVTGREIHPWRHAAGDFIVRTSGGFTEARLITARNYLSVIKEPPDNEAGKILHTIYFLFHLLVFARLDRILGVGEIVWMDTFMLEAALSGFFEAIEERKDELERPGILRSELIDILKSFERDELAAIHESLFSYYPLEDREEQNALERGLASHIDDLFLVLRNFHL